MKLAAQAVQDLVTQWVTFRLGDETFGINVMQVQEVLRMTDIAPVPGAPDHVLGIINLRGNVVTVVDARRQFGLSPKEPDESSSIVIIESNQHIVGILVDSVAEVMNLHPSEIENAPMVGNEESSKYIQGVYSREGDILILVDLSEILGEESSHEMAVF